MSGSLVVVGTGPGKAELMTPATQTAIARATDLVGHGPYLDRAVYVERGTMRDERILPLGECGEPQGAYFAMVLIPGQGRQI